MTRFIVLALSLITLLSAGYALAQESEPAAQETTTQPAEEIRTVDQAPAPSASSGSFEDGMKLYRKKRYAQAIEVFESVVASDPSNAAAYYFMGYAHYVLKHHQPSLEAFSKAFKANPTFDPREYMSGRRR